ncbi:membrane steroid-binding protein 2 [Elaeis guineensis]|uniref:Membrane steroid-binding protein 2 n=1 Tax=Elaeis guineensis var. tenera TaxID=51953 RepID=A0A6I9QEW0_ELAGV|nr:membrane steroid-binding protein 2 [Elaeis guineensis]
MALYESFAAAIYSYTGLSLAAFFTILALMVGVYRLVCGMFVAPDTMPEKRSLPHEPVIPPEPVQMGEMTLEELRAYNGSDPRKPLLMAIKGQIYDVSRGRMFYGPGGPYALFAGRDASRALALMSFDPNDLTGDLEGLGTSELEVLQDWEEKFMEKYVNVGRLVSEKTRDGDHDGSVEKTELNQELDRDTVDANAAVEANGMESDAKIN